MLTNCRVGEVSISFLGNRIPITLNEVDKKRIVSMVPGKWRTPEAIGTGEVTIKFEYQEWGQDENETESVEPNPSS